MERRDTMNQKDFRRFSLSNLLTGTCKARKGDKCTFRNLPRPYAGIGFIVKGHGQFVEYLSGDGSVKRSGELHAGDIFFVPRGSTYDSFWFDEMTYHYSFLFENPADHFNNRVYCVESISREKFESAGGNNFRTDEEFAKILRLNETPEPTAGDIFALSAAFERLLSALCGCITPKLKTASASAVDPAVNYLQSNFNKSVTVSELAKMCGLSESHFYALFREAVGDSPISYKNRVAMSNAGRLLVDEPEMSIEEVSARMGFESSAYFRKLFSATAGCSPREFRKRMK